MQGQWIGSVEGTNEGWAFLNLDRTKGAYAGTVVMADNDSAIPNYIATIGIEFTSPNFTGVITNFSPIHPDTHLPVTNDQVEDIFPEGFTLPSYVSIENGRLENNELVASWNSDIGTAGHFRLYSNSVADNEMSKYPTESVSWWKFKKIVSEFEQDKYVFRGQGEPWKLRTSFHRTSRSDLFRYSREDVSRLQQYVNSVTDYFFRTDDALEHGALLNLAQHHGFPTPLLDWTWSPYVAAYFAFEGIKKSSEKRRRKRKVRIAMFDRQTWSQDFFATTSISIAYPCMGFLDLQGIKNNRLLPQQSVTAFSNVDDIETYVSNRQDANSKQYLRILEIPYSEGEVAQKDLALMGVTAGSLFPGIEGVCRELREKYF